jgi:hypothetical protein
MKASVDIIRVILFVIEHGIDVALRYSRWKVAAHFSLLYVVRNSADVNAAKSKSQFG